MKTPHDHTTLLQKACEPTLLPPASSDPFGMPCSQLRKLRTKDPLGCLPARSLARLTQVSFLAPTVLKPAGRPCMLDTEEAEIAVSAGSLASTRHSLKLGWTLNFSPAAAAAAAAASPKGGHQGSLPECADPTGTPSWVILQLRIRGDCQPLVRMRSRRCEVSQHYRALNRLSNGALPIPEGIEHAPPFSTCFLLLQTQSRSFHSCQLGESN